jgi:quercetin dioxygenase-like cupin family protein
MMDEAKALPGRIKALPKRPGLIEAFTLAAEGCDVLFVEGSAGEALPSHTHDTDNVTAILSGEVSVTVHGQERRYGPGEWYETAALEPHAVRFDADTVQIELRFARASTSGAAPGRTSTRSASHRGGSDG